MFLTALTALAYWAVATYYPEFLLPIALLHAATGLVAIGVLFIRTRSPSCIRFAKST